MTQVSREVSNTRPEPGARRDPQWLRELLAKAGRDALGDDRDPLRALLVEAFAVGVLHHMGGNTGAIGDDIDVRPVPADPKQVHDLVDGARDRGFSQPQIDYMRSVIGICWVKAFRAGERAARPDVHTVAP